MASLRDTTLVTSTVGVDAAAALAPAAFVTGLEFEPHEMQNPRLQARTEMDIARI